MMTHITPALLLTDWLIWSVVICLMVALCVTLRKPDIRSAWQSVLSRKLSMMALVVLVVFSSIGLLDALHFDVTRLNPITQTKSSKVQSALDLLVAPLGQQDEKTYSAPFATHSFNAAEERLLFGGAQLKQLSAHRQDILKHFFTGTLIGVISFIFFLALLFGLAALRVKQLPNRLMTRVFLGRTALAWREGLFMLGLIWILGCILFQLATAYHIFGTDKVGQDVFYEAIKSIRTGFIIGTLTTLFMLPLALALGMSAGFFGGWIDDVIQYLYTTLSSIPGVLLITATILVLQVYITQHPALFPTLIQRADARLLALCLVLGLTSWSSLCRLLRGETLKLKSLEYVQASRAFGARPWQIIFRHIMPNVMHIVLITLVLDFSTLVLAEAVLSYVGVGVDPTTMSWGNMINSARLELAREPIVWWPLCAALIFMFLFVLAANLFSDAVRDAFDPRVQSS